MVFFSYRERIVDVDSGRTYSRNKVVSFYMISVGTHAAEEKSHKL